MQKTKKKKPLPWFRIFVHAGAWVPFLWLAWDYYAGNLSVNPIQDLTLRTGKYALVLLLLSLAATPANILFRFRPALQVRRALGVYAFLYAFMHFLVFIWLDYGLDLSLLPGAILEKPFVLVGLAALTILTALAVTSFDWWKKRLGKNWKRLHRLIYLAAPLVIVHFSWAIKGDVLRLQGDIRQPLAFGAAVLLLLSVRIPPVKNWIISTRSRLERRVRAGSSKASPSKPVKIRKEQEPG
jgi:sulfoxide reductase heme-binding subunit YedZ